MSLVSPRAQGLDGRWGSLESGPCRELCSRWARGGAHGEQGPRQRLLVGHRPLPGLGKLTLEAAVPSHQLRAALRARWGRCWAPARGWGSGLLPGLPKHLREQPTLPELSGTPRAGQNARGPVPQCPHLSHRADDGADVSQSPGGFPVRSHRHHQRRPAAPSPTGHGSLQPESRGGTPWPRPGLDSVYSLQLARRRPLRPTGPSWPL